MYGLWGRGRGARADVPNHSPRAQSPGLSTSQEQGSDAAARERDPGRREGGEARSGAQKGRGRHAGGGRWEEGPRLGARGSGGSALPRSRHSGESRNVEQSSGPSAATAMRGARGAWDFLFVLLLLLRVQTGGRALRVLGPRPPGAAVPREGPNTLGWLGRGGCGPLCCRCVSASGRFGAAPGLSCALPCSPAPGALGSRWWGR